MTKHPPAQPVPMANKWIATQTFGKSIAIASKMPQTPENANVNPMNNENPIGRFHGFDIKEGGEVLCPFGTFRSSSQSMMVDAAKAAGK